MRYLAMTAPSSSMEASIVEQQIIAASPILEAYGNAKTVMNNNSSRFGKFTKLLYDVHNGKDNGKKQLQGYILGSYLETYLLEKSRVVFQSTNERNYHIFYFLQKGLLSSKNKDSSSLYDNLFLSKHSCDDYWYTNQGKTTIISNVNDVDRYIELKESLGLMRIGDEMQPDLWRLTCGILNLGNIEFIKKDDGFASINMKKCEKYVTQVAKLWGIKQESLVKRLTTANVKIANNTIEKQINFKDAISNRDSIAKGIYEKIFLWLVQRINAELYQTDGDDDNDNGDMSNVLFIGILDVFGFENFYNNSLEQFCINFTNEKLQQYFNFHIIRSEQEEYIKESVFWKPLSIPDNLEYVKMVEDGKTGFFTILDSSCKVAKPDEEQFMQELFKHHGKNKTIKIANKRGAGRYRGGKNNVNRNSRRGGGKNPKFIGFTINHFADEVAYDARSFIVKNMESVHPDTAKMFNKSDYLLAKQIGGNKNGAGKGGKKRRRRLTVTGTFARGIKTLMKNLKATEPFFVRCVNPNTVKSKDIWTESVVEHQLRCGGLVEALKVLKLGYPTRVPYQDLYDRYHSSVTNPLIKNMKAEEFATVLLIAFDVSEDDYELGLTKIFFKPSKAAVLDTIMAQAGKPLTKEQNSKITKWIVNKRVQQMIGLTRTFLHMRKRIRLVRAQQEWEWSGRVSSIIGGTVVRHLGMAREKILKRKQEQAAIQMQTLFRANYERSRYIKHIEKVKKATKMVWISYRRMDERKRLAEWLDKKVEETKKIHQLKADEAAKAEAIRIENEKIRLEKAEEKRKQELAEKQAAIEKKAKQDALDLEREKQLRIKRQEQASLKRIQEDIENAKKERKLQKQSRENSIKISKQNAQAEDEQILEDRLNKQIEDNFPELSKFVPKRTSSSKSITPKDGKSTPGGPSTPKQNSAGDSDTNDDDDDLGTDGDYESEDDEDERDENYDMEKSIAEQLKYFHKTAQIGQLFLKYTGKRRRKPQDRIVKVTFNSKKEPIRISWGSGSRHIDFENIQYVAYGHYTPVFDARKDMLDEKLCLSIVGKNRILDIQAHSIETALVWVRGLRLLLNHDEKVSNEMAKKNLESGNLANLGKINRKEESGKQGHIHKRAQELIKLQQDLFIMTRTTVLRNLEFDSVWEIDESVKERFNARTMYEEALKYDIPWRHWNSWIRNKIITYLTEKQLAQQQSQQQYIYPQHSMYGYNQYQGMPANHVNQVNQVNQGNQGNQGLQVVPNYTYPPTANWHNPNQSYFHHTSRGQFANTTYNGNYYPNQNWHQKSIQGRQQTYPVVAPTMNARPVESAQPFWGTQIKRNIGGFENKKENTSQT